MNAQGQWQVAGSAAETYERALVPAVFAAWAPLVVALADPKPGDRVLDIACGTGVVARLAADRVGSTGNVVGLDLNPGMLAVAASVASHAPATSASITWREASAMKMPLPDATFDIAYCQLGLQFFPDRSAALREMYRILVLDGRLGVMVWRGIKYSPGFGALAAALDRHVSADAGGIMRAPFSLARRGRTAYAHRRCGLPQNYDSACHRSRSLSIGRASGPRLCRRLPAGGPCGKGV